MNIRHLIFINSLLLPAGATMSCVAAAQDLKPPPIEQRTVCPLWLEPDVFAASKSPPGWTVTMPQSARLTGRGLLHGAPDSSGYLKPDSAKIQKSGKHEMNTSTWKLSQPHPYETWLFCSYGPLELFKRIPASATACVATSKLERDTFLEAVFVCK
jgi:hypothetical protein